MYMVRLSTQGLIIYTYIHNKRCRTHPSRCQEDFSSLVGMFPAPRKFPRQNCHHCHVHETASTNRMRNRNWQWVKTYSQPTGMVFPCFSVVFLGMKIQKNPPVKPRNWGFFGFTSRHFFWSNEFALRKNSPGPRKSPDIWIHHPTPTPGMVRACAARVSHFLQRLQRR